MPIYDFEHNETGERWVDVVTYDDKPAYCIEHNCKYIILATPQVIGTSKDIYSKSSEDFKGRMSSIKKAYPKRGPNKAKMHEW